MTEDSLDQFNARPTQPLGDHCRGVEAAAQALTANRDVSRFDDEWSTVAGALAWSHDFGKLTPWFQTYLETNDRSHAPSPQHTYHGEVSALIALPILNSLGCADETAAAGFLAVAKHHSVLPDLKSALKNRKPSNTDSDGVTQRFQRCDDQLDQIDEEAAAAADQLISTASNGALGWDDIRAWRSDAYRQAIKQLVDASVRNGFYEYTLSLWSTLVAADKSDASNLTHADNVTELSTTERPERWKLTKRVDRLASTQLPNGQPARWYRRQPYAELPDSSAATRQRVAAIQTAANARAKKAIEANPDTNVFEITLPTGFGKTYTGLRAALTRAENRDSRVIYSLPYTSIIDQVDGEIQSVFELEPHTKPYTKHHHLAETRTAASELDAEGYSTGQETIHAEAWRSGLVLTTFTQLFESLAGPGNVQSMKLPALQDSIIILDEPQAAPHEWWGLIGRLVEYCVETYDATVILMTATQPRILEQLDDAPTPEPLIELTDACSSVLNSAPRVRFELHDSLLSHFDGAGEPLSLATATDEMVEVTNGGSNTLSVVNTVECAVSMTDEITTTDSVALGSQLLSYHRNRNRSRIDAGDYLSYLAEQTDDCALLTATLTTRLRPIDRQLLIDAIDQIIDPAASTPFDDIPTVTISTQLIEAGVDISFDRLYRDFAPLPAIVQAAGRCNRSFGGSAQPVTVWRLASPPDRDYTPSALIYGERSLLRPTQIVLSQLRNDGSDSLPESVVIDDGISNYYEQLHAQRQTGRITDELVTAFNRGNGDRLRDASLIDEDYTSIDILVLVTAAERQQYEAYHTAKADDNWQQASHKFQQLQSCLVSVPVSNTDPNTKLKIAEVGPSDRHYNVSTGQGITVADSVLDTEI